MKETKPIIVVSAAKINGIKTKARALAITSVSFD